MLEILSREFYDYRNSLAAPEPDPRAAFDSAISLVLAPLAHEQQTAACTAQLTATTARRLETSLLNIILHQRRLLPFVGLRLIGSPWCHGRAPTVERARDAGADDFHITSDCVCESSQLCVKFDHRRRVTRV